MGDFGADLHGLLPCCVRFVTHQSPGEWQHSLLACLLDFSQAGRGRDVDCSAPPAQIRT
jgi:hypothetical protein